MISLVKKLLVILLFVVSFGLLINVQPVLADTFYFTNDATSAPVSPSGKLLDQTADNDTEFQVGFSATSTDHYWYSIEIPSGAEDGGIAAGTYIQHIFFNGYTGPATTVTGETQSGTFAIVPKPSGKDKNWIVGATIFNASSTSRNVTSVHVEQTSDSGTMFNSVVLGQGYPGSGWTIDGDLHGATWTGTDALAASTSVAFWLEADALKTGTTDTIKATVILGGVTFTHAGYSTTQENASWSASAIYLNTDSDTGTPEFIQNVTGGSATTFFVVLAETGQKASIDSGGTLTITIPSDFASVTCPTDQTGWSNATTCTDSSIVVSNSGSVALNTETPNFEFSAVPPGRVNASTHKLLMRYTGTDSGSQSIDTNTNAGINVASAPDNLVFNVEISHAGASDVGPGGELQSRIYASLPRPFGKDKPALGHAITFFNASNTSRSVTAVSFTTSFSGAYDVLGLSAYPAIGGWSLTGSTVASWSGTDSVPALTARAYWVEIDPDGMNNPGVIPVTASLTADGVTYTDNSYTTESFAADAAVPVLYFSGASYVESVTGDGEEKTYTLTIFEDGQKSGIDSGASLYINIPSDFISADCVASQTSWTNKTCSNTLISASTTAAIAVDGSLDYQFKATAPIFASTSLYRLHATLDGTSTDFGDTIDTNFNGAISVAGNSYAATEIITSANQTFLSASTSPAQISAGSGSAQTFVQADKRRVRVRLQYVSGGGYVNILYNDNDTNDTRLVTPTVDFGTAGGSLDVTASSSMSFDDESIVVTFVSQTSTMSDAGAIKMEDDRGGSPGWTLNLTGNDWKTTTGSPQLDYDNTGSNDNLGKLCPFPSTATLYAESGSLTNVNKGSNDCFSSGVAIIDMVVADSGFGTGTYWLTDMKLEQFIPASPTAAVYTTTVVLTIQ